MVAISHLVSYKDSTMYKTVYYSPANDMKASIPRY